MASALDRIKARRAAKSETAHILEQSPQEKLDQIDNLFASLPTAPPKGAIPPKVNISTSYVAPVSGVEIFSTFGAGSILIDGKSVTLPVVVSDPLKLLQLKHFYQIDAPTSSLRSRVIK